MDALVDLYFNGDEVSPRGKRIKELRPVIFEFKDPLNRVTYLKGRIINPFFQLAEALWILAGRSDVDFLKDYNASIAQFSDDGVYFHAPYGERLKYFNKSDALGLNLASHKITVDQLFDVYKKISADPDTRQAVAVIYNPEFDYFHLKTKDRPCNMLLTFKLRYGALDLTVYNRSNDLHWGVFGANLCQFSTILEVMASWLGVKVGTYYQVTDSLHIYLDEYGAAETNKIFNAYGKEPNKYFRIPKVDDFTHAEEPRITSNYLTLERELIDFFHSGLNDMLRADDSYTNDQVWTKILRKIHSVPDLYLQNTYFAMLAYQAHKRGSKEKVVYALSSMHASGWLYSCLRFLYKSYKDYPAFVDIYDGWMDDYIVDYIERKGE